ncbi:hypothetical protein CC86DRAFT_435089 [Ophiobolus disseminans]|uniref:LysM domain-containing protein n=1 Tax=Ophiobolus disseminans TaxID=1469910 RepID=A0A6A6ZDD1_9PLEO|nr:hypothetical protein CC86DRAFT_435089 [Ophiobolus disseminans]
MANLAVRSLLFAQLALVIFSEFALSIRLFPSPAAVDSSVPAPCRAALSTDISCGPRFIKSLELLRGVPFNATFLGDYCSSTCTSSFNTWLNSIKTRCGTTVYDFGFDNTKTASDLVLPLHWARDTACLTGASASDYCLPKIHDRTVGYCDDCTLKYFAGMLSNSAGAGVISEDAFTSIASSCNVSPTKYPHTTVTIPESPPVVTPAPNITCWGGKQYTVKDSDTCDSIAKANSLAIDHFLYQNGIDYKCSTLEPGNTVCIRDACKTYEIQANQTCKSIARKNGFTQVELVQWNPILKSNCDNLDVLKGRTVCITPPGTTKYDFTPTATWDDAWTWPSGQWEAGPTQGVPLTNTSSLQFEIPTITLSTIATPIPNLMDYYKWCPLTEEVLDAGFDWEELSIGCTNLLKKYCEPAITGTPLSSTQFPSSCFPPYPTQNWQ